MDLIRTITGGIMIIAGIILIAVSPLLMYISLIYGIPLLILGWVIFFNKKEDEIEKIKPKQLKSKTGIK